MKKKNIFPKINGRVLFNEPLFKHTTFRVGGPCEAWIEPAGEDELEKILKFARSKRKKVFIIGMGSNVLPRDRGFNGIVIHLGKKHFKNVRFSGGKVTAGAGVALSRLVNLACENGLKGIEGLVGIPGTLGGAVFMNSGYEQNISSSVEAVKVMDKKKGLISILKKKNLKFKYRHSGLDKYIILEATLSLVKAPRKKLMERKKHLMRIKQKSQPLSSPNAGCIFRNPDNEMPAAYYIESAHLKGKRIGDAEISEKHANFIVNVKNAKAKDVLSLVSIAKKRVKSRFNVDLIPEVEII